MDLQQFNYEYLKNSMLSRIPDTIDKREGSIIWDTTMPCAKELEAYYAALSEVQKQAYMKTATGAFLEMGAAEQNVIRLLATCAVKKATFVDADGQAISMSVGDRFSTISRDTPINYAIIGEYLDAGGTAVPGCYQVQCEEAGTIGNGYVGNILPINYVSGLTTATISDLITPARDDEDDESLRARYFEKIGQRAFGGNIAQYKELVSEVAGVGGVQVYPTWNGGGSVKLSIVDTDFNPITNDFKTQLQLKIDPMVISGTPVQQGLGLGMAPIGHTVTLTTPDEISVGFSTTIALTSGYMLATVISNVQLALQNYVLSLRKDWSKADVYNRYSTTIYLARVISIILNVPGVANATNTLINGSTADVVFTQTGLVQQLPKLGAVNVGS